MKQKNGAGEVRNVITATSFSLCAYGDQILNIRASSGVLFCIVLWNSSAMTLISKQSFSILKQSTTHRIKNVCLYSIKTHSVDTGKQFIIKRYINTRPKLTGTTNRRRRQQNEGLSIAESLKADLHRNAATDRKLQIIQTQLRRARLHIFQTVFPESNTKSARERIDFVETQIQSISVLLFRSFFF